MVFISVLKNSNFLRLYLASVTSAGGASIAVVSISWIVYNSTRSAIAVTYVGLAGVIPGLALGLVAGALADRYNRRRTMIVSDVSRAVIMAFLAVFLYLYGFNLLVILGVVVIVNSFTAIFFPASSAILPKMVQKSDLTQANGFLQGTTQGSQMIGSAAGGAAISFVGVVPGLAVNAVTYAISAALLLQIASTFGRIGSADGTDATRPRLRREIAGGLSYMRANLPIMEVTLGFLPGNLLWVMVTNFTVVYVESYFPGSPAAYGYLVAGMGGGFALGALLAARMHLSTHSGIVMASMVVMQGAVSIGLSLSHSYSISLALSIGLGAGGGIINAVYYSTMQAIVPDNVLGRVLSVDQVGSFAGIPAGVLLGGVLAGAFGIGLDYAVAGLGLLVNGAVMLSLRDLRSLRYRD